MGHLAHTIFIPATCYPFEQCYSGRIRARRDEDHHLLGQSAQKTMPEFQLRVIFHLFKAIQQQQTRQCPAGKRTQDAQDEFHTIAQIIEGHRPGRDM